MRHPVDLLRLTAKMCPEFVARVCAWERSERHWHLKKAAEGFPSFGDIEKLAAGQPRPVNL
jgi:hypothetical protein